MHKPSLPICHLQYVYYMLKMPQKNHRFGLVFFIYTSLQAIQLWLLPLHPSHLSEKALFAEMQYLFSYKGTDISLACFATLKQLHDGADHVDQHGELPTVV